LAEKRGSLIDILRGVSILDMMLVHYSGLLALPGAVSKIIGYTDFAMEGFVTLSGFVVGKYYYGKFLDNEIEVIKRLLVRCYEILRIQYLMVLTISAPLAIIMGHAVTGEQSFKQFMVKSLLFLNQVPLFHILPAFIPLFLIAIPVLWLMRHGLDWVVGFGSLSAFLIGNWNPYLVSIGDKAIFPVILWQIYFVIGMFLGRESHLGTKVLGGNITAHFAVALSLFIATSLLYFGHQIHPLIGGIKAKYGLEVSKFPLNGLGLLYRGSILYVGYCIFSVLLAGKGRNLKAVRYTELLGKHSLLIFVIHVYFYKAIFLFDALADISELVVALWIAGNIVASLVIAGLAEKGKLKRRFAVAGSLG
jgi:hypothetical protein